MTSTVTAIHIFVAVILMISVLLQSGKGSGLGAAFGGSSSSVFGSRGPATLISRVTSVAAIIFMVTSLTLSIFAQGGSSSGSVVTEDEPEVVQTTSEGLPVGEDALQVAPETSAPANAPVAADSSVETDQAEHAGHTSEPSEPGPAVAEPAGGDAAAALEPAPEAGQTALTASPAETGDQAVTGSTTGNGNQQEAAADSQ
ncbi:MAG: preprotein translocase subunit SecG [Deltaproteobacteria bacterium]|jgi:preprotein translocase subunit SecG|nr:preprotein translocase subunit SecG [Deltaproteobacteria bacterium]